MHVTILSLFDRFPGIKGIINETERYWQLSENGLKALPSFEMFRDTTNRPNL